MFSNEMAESVVVLNSSRRCHTSSQKFRSSRQYYNKISANRESNCDVVQLITLKEFINYETNYEKLSLYFQYHYSKKSPV
jgi:hypothetical protein